MTAITKPTLPPKVGYVERVDVTGNRYYEPTLETRRVTTLEESNAEMSEALDMILSGVTE